MRFLTIILLFCLAVGGSALIAKFWLQGSVETEMEQRALVVLSEAGFKGVSVKFDHLNGSLNGYVDSDEEKGKVVVLLTEKLPTAYWPGAEATGLTIRPTRQPWLRVTRVSQSDEAKVEGVLSSSEETGRSLLGSRLHALPGIGKIENVVTLDPRHLPFPRMAEFASLASGLLAHSEAAEIGLQEGVLKVVGTVPNDGIKSGLIELARQISQAPLVDEIVVKVPDTFLRTSEIKITRNRFGVTLTGVLPSGEARAAILSIFKGLTPAPEITDRIEISDDSDRGVWQDHLAQIIPALMTGLTGEMTAEFTKTQIRLHGTAPDAEAVKVIETGLSPFVAAQPGTEIVAEITAAVSETGAGKGERLLAVYEGDLLVLTGQLSDETIVPRLEGKLTEVLPKVRVKNEIEIIPPKSGSEWVSQLPDFFAEALSRVSAGTFTFEENSLKMEGRTIALSDRQILQNIAVNTIPSSYAIENLLIHADQPLPKPPLLPEVRAQLAESLKELPAYFDSGSEILKSEEKTKVATIAEMLKKTGAAINLVVTGFSDSAGNAESNRQLSLKRASAVVQELVRLEIPETSMVTAAVVENVANLSRSEKAKARRVEVSLKPLAAGAPDKPVNP